MSLTLSQPTKTEFGSRYTHDFNPRISLAKSRFSPKLRATRTPSPVSLLRVCAELDDKMTTPHHPHRGLPPPSAMTLPDPGRSGPPLSSQLGAIPEPPRQWAGQEDQMRNWLAAKAEEDKRKQEEEKTRQESLRLEQRKIESDMLRESLRAGVPPAMVPMIYAGIGGGNLFNISMDWLQQYASQLQVSQQQLQQASPDMRRDGRLIGPPVAASYPQHPQQQVLPSQATGEPQPPSGPIQTTFSAYQPSPGRQQQPTSAPRSATHTQLPRLTTNEMYVHQPPPPSGPLHPLQQSQTIQQEQTASSPSIYFHHWVPPNESKQHQHPQTPASKNEASSAHPGSSMREHEYKDSPRKRKAQGDHQANPPPSAGPQYTSPSFSTTSTSSRQGGRGHARTRSNASLGRDTDTRPESSSNRRDDPPAPSFQKRDSGHQDGNGNGHAGLSHEDQPQRPASRAKQELSRAPSTAPSVPATDLSRFREAHPVEPRPGSS